MSKVWYERLYAHFPDYDAEPYTQATEAEVDFVVRMLGEEAEPRILDVGCGTGRHAMALARRGYDVVGVDLSPAMVAQARAAAEHAGLEVDFRQGDARELPFDREFDAALMLCEGGFSLMETDEMDRQILRRVAAALLPGARLIMTAPNALFMLAHPPEGDAFDVLTFRETFQLEATEPDGMRVTLQGTQRYYTPAELGGLLVTLGFEQIAFFRVTGAGYDEKQPPTGDEFEFGVTARKGARA